MEMQYHQSILELIGRTPLVKLRKVTQGLRPLVLAKVEFLNPGGSVKDRIAEAIVEGAERAGLLRPGGTIVEATSGNTGAALALVAALRGYKAVFTMPDKMSQEKIRLLKAFGAEVIVCPTAVPPDSPESYYEVAKKLARETPNTLLANQYFNAENAEAHYRTTGPEIWEQTAGRITHFVAGIGTGGTISGVGRYLKEKNPKIRIVGADPVGSILREYFYHRRFIPPAPYKVEGIGEDILPGNLHFDYIDEIYSVTDKESFTMARRLTREEALLVGGSSGSAVHVALQVAQNLTEEDLVVVLLPDGGRAYLSKFYSDEWMRENRFLDIERVLIKHILEAKSKEIPPLVAVKAEDTVREALKLMKKYFISQLPVLEDHRSVGSVEEGPLTSRVLEDQAVLDDTVKNVMAASFPVVRYDDTLERAKYLLSQGYAALLVEELGQLIGVITKFDLIEFLVP